MVGQNTARRARVVSRRPLNKVAAGALTSALVVLIGWGLRTACGVELPVEVVGALSTILGAGVAYLVPLAPGEVTLDDV